MNPGAADDSDAVTPGTGAEFSSLLEDSAEDLYESAPCGYLSTLMDGTIAKINATLLGWLGLSREEVVGRKRFSDLLTVGGRLYHETHFAPLLRMQGHLGGVALEMRTAAVPRLPVLVTSTLKRGSDGEPLLIRTTVFDATDRRAYEQELLRARRAAEEAREQAEADRAQLREALAVLQRSLLPDTLPDLPGVETAGYYHTASPMELGGDFYDLFALDDTRTAFFLGDVCGKGPQAAALTSLTRYTLRAAMIQDADPVDDLRTLNKALMARYTGDDPRYCTAVAGVFERAGDTLEVRLASGGHPPALVLRADGTAEFLSTLGGMLVGVLPTAQFVEVSTVLGPGDTLLLYTDGLTEARVGPDRELYGYDALQSFAAARAPAGGRALVDALTGLLSDFGDGLDDDTALLAIGVPATS
ncbi:PP2C family protein-serine/threonine phosphatase [Streptomyces sp. I4(2020)]|uniref:PP2C family protein-serine/threonine phosphatase n=1 Tax=Streptomyces sp. I4(2020) TaxID=2760981 RepID=UPI0018EE925D|nr:SpoIIE family protein phosphatase [Streptomyces sp. I4(2020)]MBJ6613541.1 SpoIIE family protein phosphatase [Streptomyces sp. I3(2020)]MBJ6629868.1 SpoIIE family protein phosphatase [Streptomyces sp. I4(2020)]